MQEYCDKFVIIIYFWSFKLKYQLAVRILENQVSKHYKLRATFT
jgi:hypothetical protein